MEHARIVVIGAGFAGVSTACHLALNGQSDVLILEQEELPGTHSSGRNAAMIRQIVKQPALAEMARRGNACIREWARDNPAAFAQNGSMLLHKNGFYDAELRAAQAAGVPATALTRAESVTRVELLKDADFDSAIFCANDGVVDAAALLQHYLQTACARGVRFERLARVTAIETRAGQVAGIRVGNRAIACEMVVNAAGPWAPEVGQLAGAAPVAFRRCRRHLAATPPLEWTRSDWPFVWDVSHEVYFRPESGGLLLSPCEEVDVPPGLPARDDAAMDLLARKLVDHLPSLAEVPLARSWAGIRTFTADRRFVIGFDPAVGGLFWVAGLGGHGVTCSGAVGELAAGILLGKRAPSPEFSPGRS